MEEEAQLIVIFMVKAVKALQMYGKFHPTFEGFFTPFYEKISVYLAEQSELPLSISRSSILFHDKEIYNDSEKEINISFRLFRDGIRNIIFYEGAAEKELLRFVEVIGQPSRDVDIALSLWESDFAHITFYVVEEEEPAGYQLPESRDLGIDYDLWIRNITAKEKVDFSEPLEAMLTDQELEHLKREVSREENAPQLTIAITTLIDFLNTEKSPDIIDSLISMLELCINTGDFHNARRIVHKLQNYPEVKPLEKFENETMIMSFRNLPDTMGDRDFNEFIAFIGFFSPATVPYFVQIASGVRRKERIEALRQRIAYLCQDDPRLVAGFLASGTTAAVVLAISIIGIMRAKDFIGQLDALAAHPSPLVRTALVETFADFGEMKRVAAFLNDTGADVRIKVFQALTVKGYRAIYPVMLRRFRSKEFRLLDSKEQVEIVGCMVANGDAKLAGYLEKVLFRFVIFGRKNYRPMRKLAAIGLQQIGTDATQAVLNRGLKSRNKDIVNACELVLKTR